MPELTAQLVIFLLAVGAFTLTAMLLDLRTRRIPNKLTVPFFFLGMVYQLSFAGLQGLADGMLGFALGFGFLFVMWMIGGGGGGDVKMMGALSVWLGFQMALLVLVASTVCVLVLTVAVVVFQVLVKGPFQMKKQYLETGRDNPGGTRPAETVQGKSQRRIMAYALPVCIATWAVVLWKLPTL